MKEKSKQKYHSLSAKNLKTQLVEVDVLKILDYLNPVLF